nr:biotin--[acetyl-CoA-carboxylase] ligase [Oculatella sp. LEGE 06141]
MFETLPSTNRTLWHLLEQGAREGTVVIALQQQAGRGQWGRQWQSPPGGLYLSLALSPTLAAEYGAQLTLCSAWGVATALRQFGIPVQLKWLNDLVIDGQKLGGILTETKIQHGQIAQAVVGVGINWSNPVPETGINLQTILNQHSLTRCSVEAIPSIQPIESIERLAAIVLQGLMAGYCRWQQQGIDAVLASYQALLTSMGRSIAIDNREGNVVGVTKAGELRVCLSSTATHSSGSASTEVALKPGTVQLGYGQR